MAIDDIAIASNQDAGLAASYMSFRSSITETYGERPEDYADLLRDAGLPKTDARLLDFGFGDGGFMDWARSVGYQTAGIEIYPELVDAARDRDHEAMLWDEAAQALHPSSWDSIVSIDVLEHLDLPTFRAFLKLADRILTPRGVIVARFPNGESPFFGKYQFGDLSHRTPLTQTSLAQICAPEGWRIAKAFNPRSMPPGVARSLKRRATYAARDALEILIGYVYFGVRRPLDPNIAVVLKRISY